MNVILIICFAKLNNYSKKHFNAIMYKNKIVVNKKTRNIALFLFVFNEYQIKAILLKFSKLNFSQKGAFSIFLSQLTINLLPNAFSLA